MSALYNIGSGDNRSNGSSGCSGSSCSSCSSSNCNNYCYKCGYINNSNLLITEKCMKYVYSLCVYIDSVCTKYVLLLSLIYNRIFCFLSALKYFSELC